MPNHPFDPNTGLYLPMGDKALFREFTVVEVGHDVLLCKDDREVQVLVAKPWALRKSSFDGVTFDSVTYTSTDVDVRDAGGTEETVTPAYVADEKILCVRVSADVTLAGGEISNEQSGDRVVDWCDMNTTGRDWRGPSSGGVTFRAFRFSGGMSSSTIDLNWNATYSLSDSGLGYSDVWQEEFTGAGYLQRNTSDDSYFFRNASNSNHFTIGPQAAGKLVEITFQIMFATHPLDGTPNGTPRCAVYVFGPKHRVMFMNDSFTPTSTSGHRHYQDNGGVWPVSGVVSGTFAENTVIEFKAQQRNYDTYRMRIQQGYTPDWYETYVFFKCWG